MQLKKGIENWKFWIVGSYVLIVVAIAALWGYSLFTPIDKAEETQQYESLTTIANSASVVLSTSNLDAQDAIDRVDKSETIRMTIIDEDGTVIADTRDDASTMDNHAERPEVKAALAGNTGRDRRVSGTDGTEYLYVAVPSTYKSHDIALRVSMPVSQVNSIAQTFRNTGFLLLVVTLVLSIVIGWLAFSRTSKPVSKLERVRTDFVANASHELKTPVAGIQLLSESIEQACEGGDYEMVPVFTQRLKKESARLRNLVTELLDLSRLEGGGLNGRSNGTCDLASIVGTSYEAHAEQARSKGLEFVYDDRIASDERCRIDLPPADASLLVDNLIENAINYTEHGTVTVRLQATDANVVFKVADTGIGIPTADQERIFERFYRVDTARSREMGGTGLGLSLVRHAVDRARGTVSLESAPGEGSTFTVVLPKA